MECECLTVPIVKVLCGSLIFFRIYLAVNSFSQFFPFPFLCLVPPDNFCLAIYFLVLPEVFLLRKIEGNKRNKGLFGSCFCKLFLKTVFENKESPILLISENLFSYLNLVFFCVFSKRKTGNQ